MEERCICCGEIIPEGRQVCPNCERKYQKNEENHGAQTRKCGKMRERTLKSALFL